MILVSKTYWAGMPFWFRRNPEGAISESLVLRAHDMRQLRAVCWNSRAHARPEIGVVLMHPRVDFTHHYAIPRLIQAGFCVLGAMTRGGGSDVYVEHEEMLLDLAACIRFLKEKRQVEKVVLFGNSGGGSLSAYYQAEARLPPAMRTKESPAGNPTRFEHAPMTPAEAMVYVAAHPGQGKVLLECIDASVTDENDPLSADASLDPYHPQNGFREPPSPSTYAAEFLSRYRAAQRERVQRIDLVARSILERQKSAPAGTRASVTDPMMTVYRTMANPNYVDLSLEPSKRDYGSLLSERPDLMNYSSVGFARTCTARSWLSTWSGISSKADLADNVARISEPSLLVHAARDREVFPRDARGVFEAMASSDKTFHELDAGHYFEEHADAMMDVVVPWIQERLS
jgi:alpha-beta hydrolase superfamily lysophospholipase